ncbi:MAG TPA: hypothetical protein VGN72_23970 [Tepidisphaeraceae bacterium]|nr:hypothetical protein [Tepidisphaeraceae bacterium]
MFRNLTIGKRITFGFAVVLAITVTLGAFAWNRARALSGNIDTLANDSIRASTAAAR